MRLVRGSSSQQRGVATAALYSFLALPSCTSSRRHGVIPSAFLPLRQKVLAHRRVVQLRSLRFEEPAGPPPDESEAERWERMYEGRGSSGAVGGFWGDDDDLGDDGVMDTEVTIAPMPVTVVSFDLDDTLWPTAPVITAANDALQLYLETSYPDLPEAADKCCLGTGGEGGVDMVNPGAGVAGLMRRIHQGRCAADPTHPKAPLNLTELRKTALKVAAAAARSGPDATSSASSSSSSFSFDATAGTEADAAIADECFAVWRNARHAACEEFLFPDVVASLERIRRSSGDGDVVMGSITNGNADVNEVPSLRGLFAFAITSEAVGVAKPSPRPFEAAIVASGLFAEGGADAAGAKWVHVGDDIGKDCAAAKALRLRAIWVKPPPPKAPPSASAAAAVGAGAGGGTAGAAMAAPRGDEATMIENGALPGMALPKPSSSGGDLSEQQQQQQQRAEEQRQPLEGLAMKDGVYKMPDMGSEDYLATMIVKDSADAVAASMGQVADIVEEWQRQAAAYSARPSSSPVAAPENAAEPALAPTPPPQAAPVEVAAAAPPAAPPPPSAESEEKPDRKFCIECGTQLPRAAKFCSSCGQKQPQVAL